MGFNSVFKVLKEPTRTAQRTHFFLVTQKKDYVCFENQTQNTNCESRN